AATYCVQVNGRCNSVTNCATLTVLTNTGASTPASLAVCPGSSASFSTTPSGTGPFLYQWSKNGTPISNATNSSYMVPMAGAADAGDYCVLVTGACSNAMVCATLTVFTNTAAVGPVALVHCPGTTATFTTVPGGT